MATPKIWALNPKARKKLVSSAGLSGMDLSGSFSGSAGTTAKAPSYDDIINSDPILAQTRAMLGSQSIADKSSADAAIRKGWIQYGLGSIDPNFLNNLSPDQRKWAQQVLDPQTLGLAKKNTDEGLSVIARLQNTNRLNTRTIKNALGARGMFDSGELPDALAQEGLRFKQGNADAASQAMDYLTGVMTAFAQAEKDREMQRLQALMDAAGRAGEENVDGVDGGSGFSLGGFTGQGVGDPFAGLSRIPEAQLRRLAVKPRIVAGNRRKPLGYYNNVPYYTANEYRAMLNQENARARVRNRRIGSPGVWGSAGRGY